MPGVDLHYVLPSEQSKLLDARVDKAESGAAATPSPISAEAAYQFNCVQRGHQNTLEKLPLVLAMTVLSAFSFPIIGGVGMLVFIGGRGLYAWGYTLSAEQRRYGNLTYVGMLLLVGTTLAFAVQLFRGVPAY